MEKLVKLQRNTNSSKAVFMAKDSSHPFAVLNARNYPSRREPAISKKYRFSNEAVNHAKKKPAETDEDSEMFMQALGSNVQVLAQVGNSHNGKGNEEKNPELRQSNDAFARELERQGVRKLLKKERHASSSGVSEAQKEEREPATLTAMARNGMAIGARGDAASMEEGICREKNEQEDFFAAIRGTVPLNGKGRDIPAAPENIPQSLVSASRHPLQDFMEGKVEFSVASTAEYAEGHVVGLDLMIVSQLQAREFSPEAHIDLHGLNCEQAFHNLVGFFRNAYYKGFRTVLVVTGRGLNSLNGMPVLRFRVQQWLTQDPFKRVVLAFCTAKQEDGGAGAFYVLLRRHKKSYGKIRWDVMPSDPDLYD